MYIVFSCFFSQQISLHHLASTLGHGRTQLSAMCGFCRLGRNGVGCFFLKTNSVLLKLRREMSWAGCRCLFSALHSFWGTGSCLTALRTSMTTCENRSLQAAFRQYVRQPSCLSNVYQSLVVEAAIMDAKLRIVDDDSG